MLSLLSGWRPPRKMQRLQELALELAAAQRSERAAIERAKALERRLEALEQSRPLLP